MRFGAVLFRAVSPTGLFVAVKRFHGGPSDRAANDERYAALFLIATGAATRLREKVCAVRICREAHATPSDLRDDQTLLAAV